MTAQERAAAYRQRALKGEAVPVSRELPADLDTPLSAYLKLGGGAERGFVLESCVGGERFGRYSYVGAAPSARVRLDAQGATLLTRAGRETRREGAPLHVLRALWKELAVSTLPGEAPFVGGLVGYLGYNCAAWFERHVPDRHASDLSFPDSEWMVQDAFVTLDSRAQTLKATAIARPAQHASAEAALRAAEGQVEEMVARLRRPLPAEAYAQAATPGRAGADGALEPRGLRGGRRAGAGVHPRGRLHAGGARRGASRRASAAPLALYRALRRVNPSPYLFLVELGEQRALVGASPELLVQVEDGRASRAAHRRHAPHAARPRGGRALRGGAARRREGARRARHAGGPGAQRRGAGGGARQRAASRS